MRNPDMRILILEVTDIIISLREALRNDVFRNHLLREIIF